MRRWAWSGVLAVGMLLVLFSGVVGVRAFDRACDGSLEGLRYLTNARAQLASATSLPPMSQPTPTPAAIQGQASPPQPTLVPPPPPPTPTVAQRLRELAGRVGDTALVALIRVKQNDAVAYPAHLVAAHALDAAGCGKDAVRLQWLKASLHASTDSQVDGIAAALIADTAHPDELADLRRVVKTWTERAPESDSLRRVLAVLDDPAT